MFRENLFRCRVWLGFLLIFTEIVSGQVIKEKHISALVSSKWSETPLLLEASEFLHRNDAPSFWSFALDITQNSSVFKTTETHNNKTYVDELLLKASKYVSPMQFDLLKLSLSVRTYSPAIEMSRKLAEETLLNSNSDSKCLTFVDVNSQVTCDVDKIATLIEKADPSKKPFVYQFDKYFTFPKSVTPKTEAKTVTVILYTQIGTVDFGKFHSKLVEIGSSSPYAIEYIVRHNYVHTPSDENKIALSGYGVELDIKSTEYKAKDDAKVNAREGEASSATTEQQQSHADQPVQGFMFETLKEQNPTLKDQLDEFHKHLIESQHELAPLKAWQMQDLSLQAAQKIIDAPSGDEALRLLEDLSQNFPLRARSLSKVSVGKDLKKTFKSQRQVRLTSY